MEEEEEESELLASFNIRIKKSINVKTTLDRSLSLFIPLFLKDCFCSLFFTFRSAPKFDFDRDEVHGSGGR